MDLQMAQTYQLMNFDEVNIPLFLNSLDIFAESIELIAVMVINPLYILNVPTWSPKIQQPPWALLGYLRYIWTAILNSRLLIKGFIMSKR